MFGDTKVPIPNLLCISVTVATIFGHLDPLEACKHVKRTMVGLLQASPTSTMIQNERLTSSQKSQRLNSFFLCKSQKRYCQDRITRTQPRCFSVGQYSFNSFEDKTLKDKGKKMDYHTPGSKPVSTQHDPPKTPPSKKPSAYVFDSNGDTRIILSTYRAQSFKWETDKI